MKLESKFDINNLVSHKFQTIEKDGFPVYEVLEVITQTCYGGTQVFYDCRMIFLRKEYASEWKSTGEFKYSIAVGISKEDGKMGTQRFREDELIEAKKEYIDVILGGKGDVIK